MHRLNKKDLEKYVRYCPLTGIFVSAITGKSVGTIHVSSTGRKSIKLTIGKMRVFAHRAAWVFMTGEDPAEQVIDHKNRDSLDNRWKNLQKCTHLQNSKNLSKFKNNTTGYAGVCEKAGKYVAYATVNKKKHHLGYFPCPKEASEVRTKFLRKMGFSEGHGTKKKAFH